MVAHGTIAFDTLTTSDQVKSGTEKSLDTSYLFNGSAKSWCNYTTAATFVNNGSFNVGSLTDSGAGSCKMNFTNVFNDDDYSTTGLQSVGYGQLGLNAQETTYTWCISYDGSNSAADSGESTMTTHGDLA
jgi:hypothetical protein